MTLESTIQWLGGLLAYTALGIVLWGLARDPPRIRARSRTRGWLVALRMVLSRFVCTVLWDSLFGMGSLTLDNYTNCPVLDVGARIIVIFPRHVFDYMGKAGVR